MVDNSNRKQITNLMRQLDHAKDVGNWKKVADIAMQLDKLSIEMKDDYRISLRVYLARLGMAPADAKSQNWFKRRYSQLKRRRFDPEKMKIGGLFFYSYKPETPGTWDFAPLMLNLGHFKSKDGNKLVIGLNLHYVPPRQRARILISLSDLIELGSKNRLLTGSRMSKLTWEIAKRELGEKVAKLLIHSYRLDRFKSAPEEIHPSDYASVIRQPLQKFKRVK